MPFTDVGRKLNTFSLGSDVNLFIAHIGIGSGSGTAVVGDTTLLHDVNRTPITGSPNFQTTQKVSFQADFNGTQMSGIHLTEFGLFNTGSNADVSGSVWLREAFGSVVFDGTLELQILTDIEVF